MANRESLAEHLARQGISRRSFLKFCAMTASSLALPTGAAMRIAHALETTPRPRVIWISGQECTGCTESTLRSFGDTLEGLILNAISLDYHNTLMAPAGAAAEKSRDDALMGGGHVLVVDGSIPFGPGEPWAMIGGRSVLEVVQEAATSAALILAVGNCAAFGGIPKAKPNPSSAAGVDELLRLGELVSAAPLVNLPGCPPIPEVITGTIMHYLLNDGPPALDPLHRPTVFYGETVHDTCTRLAHFQAGNFAKSFDDEGARQGHCLLELGCKGPVTFNACSRMGWNGTGSFPMHSGHGCLGCSEPDFWDRVSRVTGETGFYHPPF